MESPFLNYITGETLKSNSEATKTDKAAAAPKSKVVVIFVVLRIFMCRTGKIKGDAGPENGPVKIPVNPSVLQRLPIHQP
jgi:hypothetical protein